MAAASTSRRARRFVIAGLLFLVLWQVAILADAPSSTTISLGLLGFVFHTVFGKAYALVPSYFERELATPRLPTLHLPLSVLGVVGLAIVDIPTNLAIAGTIGALSWFAGVLLFLAALGWTIRDNLSGAETGTGDANADRRPVDRIANAFVPVALAYFGVGSYALVGQHTPLPTLLDGYAPRSTHLLAAGAAALLLFAIGFRLLPRFLVATPPRGLVWIVLPAGAIGPGVLAVTLPAGPWFPFGAAIEALAVVGFAIVYIVLFIRSDRRRVGFYGVLLGVVAGTLAAGLATIIAHGGTVEGFVRAHRRLNLLGFLGLSIVGVSYQFYPPAVGTFPGASDRTAFLAMGALGAGLGLEVIGVLGDVAMVVRLGEISALLGGLTHATLILGLFAERYWVSDER